jgi:hypothetical protein
MEEKRSRLGVNSDVYLLFQAHAAKEGMSKKCLV